MNKIDIDNNFISHRLYKDHVIFEKSKSVKKLNMIGRDLNKIIFVDNRNRKPNIININNLGEKNEYCHNNTNNTKNIDKGNINGIKGIYSLKNKFPKNENIYFIIGRYSANIYLKKILKKKKLQKLMGLLKMKKYIKLIISPLMRIFIQFENEINIFKVFYNYISDFYPI